MPRMASAPPIARATSLISRSASGDAAAEPCSAMSASATSAPRRTSVVPRERAPGHRQTRRFDPRAQLLGVAHLLRELRVNFGDRQHAPVDRHVALDVELAISDVVVVCVAPEIDFPA